MKKGFYLGAVLLAALALSARSKADTITVSVSGSSKVGIVTSFSFSTSGGGGVGSGTGGSGAGRAASSLTIETPLSDPLVSQFYAGHHLAKVTLDFFKIVGGTPTLYLTIETDNDFVAKTSLSGSGNSPEEKVTLDYSKVEYKYSAGNGNGGPGPSNTPEPSELMLLASGVVGLLGFRKRQSV